MSQNINNNQEKLIGAIKPYYLIVIFTVLAIFFLPLYIKIFQGSKAFLNYTFIFCCLYIYIFSVVISFKRNYFDFYETHLILYKMFGDKKEKILYSDLEFYEIKENIDKNGNIHHTLAFSTKDKRYFHINPSDDFWEIANTIQHKTKKGVNIYREAERKFYLYLSYLLTPLSLFLLLSTTQYYKDVPEKPTLCIENTEKITGTVKIFVKHIIKNKNSNRTFYTLKLKEYPDYVFNVDNAAYSAFIEKATEEYPILPNDTVFVRIPKHDFEFKITKTKVRTWNDSAGESNIIQPLALQKNDINYYSFQDFVRKGGDFVGYEKGSNTKGILVLLFLAGVIMWFYGKNKLSSLL